MTRTYIQLADAVIPLYNISAVRWKKGKCVVLLKESGIFSRSFTLDDPNQESYDRIKKIYTEWLDRNEH